MHHLTAFLEEYLGGHICCWCHDDAFPSEKVSRLYQLVMKLLVADVSWMIEFRAHCLSQAFALKSGWLTRSYIQSSMSRIFCLLRLIPPIIVMCMFAVAKAVIKENLAG